MIPIARRMLLNEKSKFVITICGVAFISMLVLFLIGIYQGVKLGATGYVLNSKAEIWLCKKNSSNLLRSSSFMHEGIVEEIKNLSGISRTEGILRVITNAEIKNRIVTLFLFGIESASNMAYPNVIEGGNDLNDGELILDKSFVLKYSLSVGDSIRIQEKTFHIKGISTNTNATVAQFAFSTLKDAQKLIGFPNIIGFVLLWPEKKNEIERTIRLIKNKFPSVAVFNKEKFIQNNLQEMQTGVLPILWTIAIFGSITGAAIITLMLYGFVIEKRENFALLKAIGAEQRFITLLVIRQSLLSTNSGFALGVLLTLILTPAIIYFVPELNIKLTAASVIMAFIASNIIGAIGAVVPINKLFRIYPAEVFRV